MLTVSRSSPSGSATVSRVPDTSYHHGHLRQALIDAAVEVARERGPDGLAVRDLARRVGVSHNAAYRHFADREELVAVVSSLTMARLVAAMQRRLALVDTDDPVLRARRRLAATGRGYVEFALAEPGLFRLAFAVTSVHPPEPAPERDPYALLGQALDDLVTVGFLTAEAREGAEVTCWSAVHGFAVLVSEGPLRASTTPERDLALAQVLDTIDRSYAATTGSVIGVDDLQHGP